MTCKEIYDFLMDYLNGELPESQRAIFAAHLDECPDCVSYMQSYEETVKLCRSVPKADCSDVPEELIRAILNARSQSQ